MILPGDPILCEEQRQNEEAEEKEEDKVARVVEHADSVDSRTASENELIPAQAAALNLWKACCYIRELVALHRARGPLTPTCEQVAREASAFVDIGGAAFVAAAVDSADDGGRSE